MDSDKNKSLIISIIASAILIPTFGRVLYVNAGEVIHPTPFLKLDTTKVKIKGTDTTGTLTGKSIANAKITFKDSGGIDDTLTTFSDKNGNFKIKKLDYYTDYKVTASKNGKKSPTKKVSVSDIPKSAYTKFTIKGSNDDTPSFLEIKTDSNNQVTISGTASPDAKIRLEDSDTDYSLVKETYASTSGKWKLQIDGPTDQKEKDYNISAKISGLLKNDGNEVDVTNPNYKKVVSTKASTSQESSKTEDSSDEYPDIATKFDINNMSQYSDSDLFAGVTLKNFYVKSLGADSMKQYHLLLTPEENSDQYFLVVTKSKKRIAIGDTVTVECGLNGSSKVNNAQINSGIDNEYLGKDVILTTPDKISVMK